MAFKPIITLRERDMLVAVNEKKSIFIRAHSPFSHAVPDICTCGGILAPTSGALSVEAIRNDDGQWYWRYAVEPGAEWEYTVRDEFQEYEDRAYREFMRNSTKHPAALNPRIMSEDEDRCVSFTLPVDRLASALFPGRTLGQIMHDAKIPVVMLQGQLVGPAWGKFTIRAYDDLEGWNLHFQWDAGHENFPTAHNDRVAGQDVIDNWNDVRVESAVNRFCRKVGGSSKEVSALRVNWRHTHPQTALDEYGRIVSVRVQDDDEL